jgi:DNA-directed RNA polymerase specialized sigma24 family protein
MSYNHTGRTIEDGTPSKLLREAHDLLVREVGACLGPLSAENKALLEVIVQHGGTFEQVASLRGEHAATVSRRFHRLLSKLLIGRKKPRCKPVSLNPLERSILTEYYLCGRPQADIADKLSISRYRVRKTLDRIRKYTKINTSKSQHQGACL